MRVLARTGPVLLALGLVLTGCNKSTDSQTGAPPGKGGASGASSSSSTSSSSEYVLTVEGMV